MAIKSEKAKKLATTTEKISGRAAAKDSAKPKKSQQEDEEDDEVEQDDWEKQEDDNWDPDFDEFDLPKSKGKRALPKKERKRMISKLKRMNLMMTFSMIKSWMRTMIFNSLAVKAVSSLPKFFPYSLGRLAYKGLTVATNNFLAWRWFRQTMD